MRPWLRRVLVWCAGLWLLAAVASGKGYRVTVGPAEVDRAAQVVMFAVEQGSGELEAISRDGMRLPVQVAVDGAAVMMVPWQKAGETLVFELAAAKAARNVEVTRSGGRLDVVVAAKPAFAYQMDKDALPRPEIKPVYKRAGYLHPIYTTAGTIVSDDYPPQHVHHHGIWTPWTKTSFQGRAPDFWNMGAGTGTVEFVSLDKTWSGPVHGGFVARHKFVDLSAKPEAVTALHETWEVTAYDVPAHGREARAGSLRVFDLVTTQTCATNDPLILPKYHYGGFGFRGRGEWLGKDKAFFLTSEGTTDRVKANHERMRWVHLWGQLPGGPAGMTVLGHPENFRAPMPVRVHHNEPYVSFIPSQLGEFRIEPGKPYVARYRFVAFDGEPDRARLDALWNGYAMAATVKVAPSP